METSKLFLKALARIVWKRFHGSTDITSGPPMLLIASLIVFAAFFANVALGAFADAAVLGDVGEMLVLLGATILFVVAILQKEADRNKNNGG